MTTGTSEVRCGLKKNTIEKINSVFALYPKIDQAILYGSRAKGTFRNGSDIDLTLKSDTLTHRELLSIEIELDDLLLPYKIDLSLFRQIDNADLIAHIERVGVVFYERPESHCPIPNPASIASTKTMTETFPVANDTKAGPGQ
jgi:predicted nucleotidyltransferase